MAGFNPLDKGGLVLLPAKGAAGAAGTAGAGEPYTTVDSLSGTPRSVTDWGPLINAAIVSGTRRFLFGPFDYPFTTQITAHDRGGVHFSGASSAPGALQGGSNGARTRLLWKGTGTGYAIDLTVSAPTWNSNAFEDISFTYDQVVAWTGSYFDLNNAFTTKFERCDFSTGTTPAVGNAKACIDAHNMNTLVLSNCDFGYGFACAVHHRDPAVVGNFGNVLRFNDCTFRFPAVENPGKDVLLSHCILEGTNLAANQSFIYDTAQYVGETQISLALRDCAFWDAGANGSTNRVVFAQFNTWYLAARDCIDHLGPASFAALYDMRNSGGSVQVDGGYAQNVIDVGDATGTGGKSIVRIVGLDVESSTTATNIIKHVNTGHFSVEVSNLNTAFANNLGVSGQVSTVGHEQVEYVDQPAIAAHAGVTNQTQTLVGTDLAGFIHIANTGGVTGPTGDLVDITLAAPAVSSTKASSHRRMALVEVFAFKPDDGNNFYITPDTNVFYTCKPYAHSVSVAAAGSQGSFSIGVGVGIPAGAILCVGYRVIHL